MMLPFGVVGVALFAPAHGEAVGLAAVHDERNGLGRLAERDRQAAGGERIERAGMAGRLAANSRLTTETAWVEVMPIGLSSTSQPWTSRFSRLRCPWPPPCDDAGASPRLHSLILAILRVEIAPDLGCSQKLLDPFGFVESLVDPKRISGANFRLTRRAISPRRKRLLRSSAASTRLASRPPSGIT